MKYRYISCISVLLSLAFVSTEASAEELTVAIYGGTVLENTKTCLGGAFKKETGASIRFIVGGSNQNAAKVKAARGRSGIDVAYMDPQYAIPLKKEDLLETLDPGKIKNMADVIPQARDADNKYVGTWLSGTAIAYNPKLVKSAPTSWTDLWNPAYKEQVVVGDISVVAGQAMLIMAARMNGGSIQNVEPGFAAMRKLNANVLTYFTQPDQLVALFDRGDIAIATWYIDRSNASMAKGLPIKIAYPKEGAVGAMAAITIPKGAPHPALAQKYIDIILSTKMQGCFAASQFGGPTNGKTTLPPELGARLPYGHNLENMYFPDYGLIAQHLGDWTKEWARKVVQ